MPGRRATEACRSRKQSLFCQQFRKIPPGGRRMPRLLRDVHGRRLRDVHALRLVTAAITTTAACRSDDRRVTAGGDGSQRVGHVYAPKGSVPAGGRRNSVGPQRCGPSIVLERGPPGGHATRRSPMMADATVSAPHENRDSQSGDDQNRAAYERDEDRVLPASSASNAGG